MTLSADVLIIGVIFVGILLMLLAIRRLSRDVMDAWVLFALGIMLLIVAWRLYNMHILTIDDLEYDGFYLTLLESGLIL